MLLVLHVSRIITLKNVPAMLITSSATNSSTGCRLYGATVGVSLTAYPYDTLTDGLNSEITEQVWANMKVNCQLTDTVVAANNISSWNRYHSHG